MIPRNSPLIFTREVICVRWGDYKETPWQSICMKPVQKIKLQFANSYVEGLAVLWMKSACCRNVSFPSNSSGLALLALFCQWGNWDFEQGNNLPKVLCSLSCRENFKPMTLLSILSISLYSRPSAKFQELCLHWVDFMKNLCLFQWRVLLCVPWHILKDPSFRLAWPWLSLSLSIRQGHRVSRECLYPLYSCFWGLNIHNI